MPSGKALAGRTAGLISGGSVQFSIHACARPQARRTETLCYQSSMAAARVLKERLEFL